MIQNILTILYIFFLFVSLNTKAQNLFKNPGFEDTTLGCPPNPNSNSNSFPYVSDWKVARGSPDYGNCGAIHGSYGTYDPYAGSGYAGVLVAWSNSWDAHEALMQKLDVPLIECAWYEFSVYAKHKNANNLYSVNVYGSLEEPPFDSCVSHFKNCSEFILLGTTAKIFGSAWKKYSFKFQASDTFRYISIMGSYLTPVNSVRFLAFDEFSLTLDTAVTDTATISMDTTICIGDSVKFEDSPIGCGNYFWYTTSDPNTIISTDSFLTVATQTSATYIFNTGLKENRYNVIVNPIVHDSIITDTSICPGFSVQLTSDNMMYGEMWEPGIYLDDSTIYNPIANPEEEISYTRSIFSYCKEEFYQYNIHLLDLEGCPKENTITAFPSIFTPNEDGLNDEFNFVNIKGITSLQYLRIINRYGQIVFESDNISKGWDGKKKGIPQPIGTYYYQVKGTHITEGEFYLKGIFELLK